MCFFSFSSYIEPMDFYLIHFDTFCLDSDLPTNILDIAVFISAYICTQFIAFCNL